MTAYRTNRRRRSLIPAWARNPRTPAIFILACLATSAALLIGHYAGVL